MVEAKLIEDDLIGAAAARWCHLTIDDKHVLRLAYAMMFANPHQIGDYREGSLHISGYGRCSTYYLRYGFANYKLVFVKNIPFVYDLWLSGDIDAVDAAVINV